MATIASRSTIGTTLGNWRRSIGRALEEERQRRRVFNETYAELSTLSDRELADIGLTRLEIGDVAREASYAR